jgi:nitrogen fixation NifU-like protein
MDIYREKLLDHYNNPRNFGTLPKADAVMKLENISCGDSISMEIKVKDGKLTDIKYIAEGCAVSIASASLLSEYVKGKALTEIAKIDIERLQQLLGVQLSLSRIRCAALSLETLKKCTDGIIANLPN